MLSLLQAAWQPGSAEFTLWILHWTFLDNFSPSLHWWVSFFTKAVDSSTSRQSTALPSTCPTFKRTNTVLSTFYIYCFPRRSNWIIMLAFSLIHLWLCFLHTFSLSLYHRSALVGVQRDPGLPCSPCCQSCARTVHLSLLFGGISLGKDLLL